MAKLMPALVGEAIGVFALSFVGILAINQSAGGLVGVALAHGLILSIMITIFAATSGGHLNPAVTIGLMVGGKIKPGDAIAYIIAQVFGGFLAGLALMAIFKTNAAQIVANGTPAIATDAVTGLSLITVGGAFIAEMIATFFLVLAVWGTAVDPRAPKIGGFGIGLVVTADILAIGPLTGAAMNPARALGPALASLIGNAKYDWGNHWVYWAGPIAGGIFASVLYKAFMWPKDAK